MSRGPLPLAKLSSPLGALHAVAVVVLAIEEQAWVPSLGWAARHQGMTS